MSAPNINTRNKLSMHFNFIRHLISFLKMHVKQKLPVNRIFANLNRYRTLWYLHEMEVAEFYYYYLWREKLSEKDYKSFIGWKKHILSLTALNPIQYRCLTENKLVFYTYCKSMDVPTPEIYAIFDPNMPDIDDFPTLGTVDQLTEFVSTNDISEFVLKPVEGTRGQSILVVLFNKDKGEFQTVTGEKLGRDQIKNVLEAYNYRDSSQSGFMVQERLTPHSSTLDLSKYVPFSYRILTILDGSGQPHIIEVYGKCAVGDSDTDNWEGGGLALRLDQNGVCFGANEKGYGLDPRETHPTHGFKFIGWQAPFYKEVCEVGIKAAKAFFYVRCVAWDIIVAESGVYVIEGNNPWSVLQQEAYYRGLWQGVFGEEAGKAIKNGPVKSPWW